MKQITTEVHEINGQFDIYANKETKRTQNYRDLADEMGKNWDEMSKRARANFRRRHADKIKEISTEIKIYKVKATIPNIFSEHQLKEAAINHLIHNTSDLFLKCKNDKTGYSCINFEIN